jgi:hypothetical protein
MYIARMVDLLRNVKGCKKSRLSLLCGIIPRGGNSSSELGMRSKSVYI